MGLDYNMLGIIGTIAVIAQMALLSVGYDPKIAMLAGLIGCCAWVGHALSKSDHPLLVTNLVVAGFGVWGIV